MLTLRALSLRIVALTAATSLFACVGDAPLDNPVDAGSDTLAAKDTGAGDSAADANDGALPADGSTDGGIGDAPADGPAPLFKFPTHATPSAVLPNAGDLVNPAELDTDANTLKMAPNGPAVALPAGAAFIKSGNRSILSVGALMVGTNLLVKGSLPLVIVASKAVTISATINGAAVNTKPGPGGVASGNASLGAGGQGLTSVKGGGGGGYGSVGGAGGGTGAGAAGAVFSTVVTDLFGGAPGGKGSGNAGTCGSSGGILSGIGGAGGGALSIASTVSITVTASGVIHVGGGAGGAGCNGESAPGGGSGGLVFLEAPTMTVAGKLLANGGGGGGGPSDTSNGNPGKDATPDTVAAPGGAVVSGGGSGKGGNGAVQSTAAVAGSSGTYSGGGGGGVGRVRLRYRTAPTMTGATLSGTKDEYPDL